MGVGAAFGLGEGEGVVAVALTGEGVSRGNGVFDITGGVNSELSGVAPWVGPCSESQAASIATTSNDKNKKATAKTRFTIVAHIFYLQFRYNYLYIRSFVYAGFSAEMNAAWQCLPRARSQRLHLACWRPSG